MITEQDLQAAIAECKGKRNPDSSTCIKLAAFLIIQEHLYPEKSQLAEENSTRQLSYSYAEPPEQVETIIDYQSDTEFSAVIDGRQADDVWPVMEELMEVLRRTNKPLYNATIRKIQD